MPLHSTRKAFDSSGESELTNATKLSRQSWHRMFLGAECVYVFWENVSDFEVKGNKDMPLDVCKTLEMLKPVDVVDQLIIG